MQRAHRMAQMGFRWCLYLLWALCLRVNFAQYKQTYTELFNSYILDLDLVLDSSITESANLLTFHNMWILMYFLLMIIQTITSVLVSGLYIRSLILSTPTEKIWSLKPLFSCPSNPYLRLTDFSIPQEIS